MRPFLLEILTVPLQQSIIDASVSPSAMLRDADESWCSFRIRAEGGPLDGGVLEMVVKLTVKLTYRDGRVGAISKPVILPRRMRVRLLGKMLMILLLLQAVCA